MGFGNSNSSDLSVTITKAKLLEALRKNRDEHAGQVALAETGFRLEYMKSLRRMMKLAKAGKEFPTRVDLREPVSYVKKYDEAISMLEAASNEELKIDSVSYRNYVLNEWDWAQDWGLSNTGYVSAALADRDRPPPTGKPGRPRKTPLPQKKLKKYF